MMDNAEEIMHMLEEFSKMKPQMIPRELDDYLGYVAKTGNPVFKWSLVKHLFREKMLNVINDFYEDFLTIDLPHCPNVDVFNYDRMKASLLERLDSFHGAPFTVQRLCELLMNPRKEYNRADKFMRAIEKNILVVSTREPGRYSEFDCESTQECSVNGVQESGDGLDSTFICNDLDPVPVSSHKLGMVDTMADSHGSERLSVANDNEVSSDCDEVANNKISNASEETDHLDTFINQLGESDEEEDSSNVSSSDVTLPIDSSSIPQSDEADVKLHENPPDAVISTSEHVESNEVNGETNREEIKVEVKEEPSEISDSTNVCGGLSVPSSDVLPTPSDETSNSVECDQTNDCAESKNFEDGNEVKESESVSDSVDDGVSVKEEPTEGNRVEKVECDTSDANGSEIKDSTDAPEISSESNVSEESDFHSTQNTETPAPSQSEISAGDENDVHMAPVYPVPEQNTTGSDEGVASSDQTASVQFKYSTLPDIEMDIDF